MTIDSINDGTATVVVEWFWDSNDSDVIETYQIELLKNDQINYNSVEPYPYYIESIKRIE